MSRIIAVHSFRGGAGKSFLTASLAVSLAREGWRVGVVDASLQSPAAHLWFGWEPSQTYYALNDYLWGRCVIAAAAHPITPPTDAEAGLPVDAEANSAANAAGGRLWLIPARLEVAEMTALLRQGYDAGLLNDGLRDVTRELRLNFLLIDTQAGINEAALLAMALADDFLVLLRPEPQDLQGTAVTIAAARRLSVRRLGLVLNQTPDALDSEALRRQVEADCAAPVAAILPQCDALRAPGAQPYFCLRHPAHPINGPIQSLVARLRA